MIPNGIWANENPYPPIIRLHIVPNSNETIDQSLKFIIRDGILEKFKFEDITTYQEAVAYMEKNLDEINFYATEIIRKNGQDYLVETRLAVIEFPDKEYGNEIYPAGLYQSLTITIGQGEGNNWWCVLYPPLCHVPWMEEENQPEIDRNTALPVSLDVSGKIEIGRTKDVEELIKTYRTLIKKIWLF